MTPRIQNTPPPARPSADDRSLLLANRRLTVDERLRRHDTALNELLALRAAVHARRPHA